MIADDQKIPVWLDIDAGVDHSLALLYAAANPRIHLVGVSTVFGRDSVRLSTRNALRLLKAANANVDVFEGATRPLIRRVTYPESVQQEEESTLFNVKLPDIGEGAQAVTGDERFTRIYQKISSFGRKVNYVATGALTNLSILLQAHASVVQNLDGVYFAGGAIGLGDVTPAAERNVLADPEAARIVFQFPGIKLYQVPLEGVQKLNSASQGFNDQVSAWQTPFGATVRELVNLYSENYTTVYGRDALAPGTIAAPQDVTPLFALLYAQHCTLQALHVDIETRSKLCEGSTVIDTENRIKNDLNVVLVKQIKGQEFWDDVLAVLARLNA